MSRLEGEKKALLVRDGSAEGTDDYEIKTYSDNIVLTSTTQKETGESGKSKPNSELTKNEKYTSLNDFLAKAEAAYDLGTDSNGNNGNDLPKAIRLNGENASSAPDYSVAIGEDSKANGEHNFAIGHGNIIKGHDNIGIGAKNYIEGGFYNYILGAKNTIYGKSCNNIITGEENLLNGSDESKIIYRNITRTVREQDIEHQGRVSGGQKFEIQILMPDTWERGWFQDGDWSITYYTENGPEIVIAHGSSKLLSIHESAPDERGRVYIGITFAEAGAPSYLFSAVKEFKMTFTRRKAQYVQPLPIHKCINGYHNNIVQNKYFPSELSYPFRIYYRIAETPVGYMFDISNRDQEEYLRNYIGTTSSLWSPYGKAIPLRLKYDDRINAFVIVNYESIKSIFPLGDGYIEGLDKWPFEDFPSPTNYNTTILGQYNNPDPDDIFQIGCGTSNNDRKNALSVNKDGIVKSGEKNYLESSGQFTGNLSTSVYIPSKITSLKLTKGIWIISANITFNHGEDEGDRDLLLSITTDTEKWKVRQVNSALYSVLSTTTIKYFNKDTTVYLEGASSTPPMAGPEGWKAAGTIIAARIG